MQIISNSEYRRTLARALQPLGLQSAPFAGSTVNGSNNISNISNFAGLEIGMVLSGVGIAPGSVITQLNGTTNTLTMSNPATANGTQVALSGNIAVACLVHLAAQPPSPGPEPTPSSFVEADFDGYAPIQISMETVPWTNNQGNAEVDTQRLTWILTVDPVTGNVIYAYWIDYVVGSPTPTVMLWEPFTPNISMEDAGDAVVCVVPLQLPQPGSVDVVQ